MTARRALLTLAAITCAAGLIMALTGGGVLTLGGIRLSLRSARNPLTFTGALIVIAWLLAPAGRRWRTLADDWRTSGAPIERALAWLTTRARPGAVAALLAVGVVALGVVEGAHVAGGSDSYGYVSQSRLWAEGRLHVEPALLRQLPADVPPEAAVPLGYRLADDRQSIVPTYSAGYPLLMAVFERLGGPDAVFLVVPLLAGLAIWCTYLTGAAIAGRAAGLIAAAFVATNPALLFTVTHPPMSDIPAMAWWAAALAAGTRASATASLVSGLAAGAAILTRPNLVPLAIIVAALQWRPGVRLRRLALFAAGPVIAALAVAAINTYWYGSPATSGYGQLAGTLYRWSYLGENLSRYGGWLWDSQPWLIVFSVTGIVVLARRQAHRPVDRYAAWAAVAFAGAVLASYAFYLPLPDWSSLRLLLPALPVVCLLAAIAVLTLPADPLAARVVVAVMVAALGVAAARDRVAFDADGDRRFAVMGRYIDDRLPARAVIVAMHHSGSANFYSGRPTLRWDMLRGEQLDPVLARLRAHGYEPYLLLDDFEEPDFTTRYRGISSAGALDWPPLHELPRVKLWAIPPARIE